MHINGWTTINKARTKNMSFIPFHRKIDSLFFLSIPCPLSQDYSVHQEILIHSLNNIFWTMEVATFDYVKKWAIFGDSLHCIMSKDGHIWKLELLNQSINICHLVALNCCSRYFGLIWHYIVSMLNNHYFDCFHKTWKSRTT